MNQQKDMPEDVEQRAPLTADPLPHRGDTQEDGPGVSPDTVAELRFQFLQQISTLALLSAGAAITLLRTVLAETPDRTLAFLAVGLLVASALTALTAQQYLVERLGEEAGPEESEYLLPTILPRSRKLERLLQNVAVFCLAIGVGLFAGFVVASW